MPLLTFLTFDELVVAVTMDETAETGVIICCSEFFVAMNGPTKLCAKQMAW